MSDNCCPAPRKLCDFLIVFRGYFFDFFFQISRIFLIILRCSWVKLSENVHFKTFLLTLIEKYSRTCDFCLITAERPVTSTCSRSHPICGDLAVVLILERGRLSKHHNIDIFSERNIGITLECNQTPFMIYGVDRTQVLIERGHWFQMHIILYRTEDQTCKLRCSRFSESRKYRDKWF